MNPSGRPRIPEHRKRKKLNVTVPAELIQAAAEKAESQGIDLSHFVEEAVKAAVAIDQGKHPGKSCPSTPALTAVPRHEKKRNA